MAANKKPAPAPPVICDDPADSMQCSDHPYRSNPGGICAFCLQEKLGKLVSSSTTTNSTPFFSSSSASPSPRPSSAVKTAAGVLLKRSKTVAPRPLDAGTTADTPRKKRFWRFLSHRSNKNKIEEEEAAPAAVEEEESQPAAVGRKLARSRSVGCGSRSFSGDFLERISTGFGDCTLRRAESQRVVVAADERRSVRCGGIFGGFGIVLAATAAAAEEEETEEEEFVGGMGKGGAMVRGGRGRSWAWALASPMRAFRSGSGSKGYRPNNAISSINAANRSSNGGVLVNGNGKLGNGNAHANSSLLAVRS